jgi:type IV pilus assembly protein PilY1
MSKTGATDGGLRRGKEIIMGNNHSTPRIVGMLAMALALVMPSQIGRAEDSDLFSTVVPPNVLLYVDNSGSMNNVVWHPAFDPSKPSSFYGCERVADNLSEASYTSSGTFSTGGVAGCSARTLFIDPAIGSDATRWANRYRNWYQSTAVNAIGTSGLTILQEIQATNNGTNGACAQGLGAPATYGKYRRARVTAVQDVIRNVICDVNASGEVRFGLAQFRRQGTASDPNGAYVLVPVNDYKWDHDSNPGTPKIPFTYTLNGVSKTHEEHLKTAITGLDGESWTPLGEGLFQLYTYFMSRSTANIPLGADGVTKFPAYVYNTQDTSSSQLGGAFSGSGPPAVPGSPVQFSCQKNFVIVLTDGEPTKDNFSVQVPTNTAAGFADFRSKLIGDFNPDNVVPEAGNEDPGGTPPPLCGGTCTSFYLDDIAKFMHDRDFRPDLTGDQKIDVYTVGFATGGAGTPAEQILLKTAAVGGGTFYSSNDPDALSDAIVSSVADIIQKSQAFTAATVPATRTSAGGNFYTSLFVPFEANPYWEGHLKSFQLAANGDILDKNGACAVQDPLEPAECKNGPFKPDPPATPFWDAGQQIPLPGVRKLYTSVANARVNFDMAAIDAVNLTGLTFPAPAYTGSTATNIEGRADEIVQNVRGCVFGTGVAANVSVPFGCIPRPWLLGDIFHSNPVVVGPPALFLNEASYKAFASNPLYATRKRVIYAGANDGYLRGFDAGTFVSLPAPGAYDRGTGAELFGFMPWPIRQKIKDLPRLLDRRGTYYVDGSPAASDVWIYPTSTTTNKALSGSEWKTVLIGGLRQGGKGYYALDVTDPSAGTYPAYMWEYPQEGDAASLALLGESWSEPIITKVRVDIGGATYERWVAIVGGGYDVSGDPNDAGYVAGATAGRGIFMIDVKTGELLAKKVFGTGAGQVPSMVYAIPSTPAVLDLDFDGFADVVYVGDLGGNMWKWVIAPPGDDPINDGTGDVTQPSWPFTKFFTTPGVVVGASTFYKSVFYPPAATFVGKKLWLAWGTGERTNLRFVDPSTGSSADNNRLYAMQDRDPYEVAVPPFATLTEADLDAAPSDTACNPPPSGKVGYYIVAMDSEKFVTNFEIFAYYIFAGSFIPTITADPCASGGEAGLYVVRIQCGQGFFDSGVSPTPRRLTLGAGMPTDPRLTISSDGGGGSDANRVIVNKQQGDVSNIEAPEIPNGGAGVLYWRERQ